MRYKKVPAAGFELSAIGLGGHEFLSDGTVKGMGEDFHRSVTAGVIWEGFGAERRKRVIAAAHEAGINFFDVTMDAEKEALGRNLAELPSLRRVFVQTRPEGMVYDNDPSDVYKRKILDYELLRAEAQRAAGLLRREFIDFYNFGLHAPAVRRDPNYLPRIAENIARLKADGLIRMATADSIFDPELYLEEIQTGAFDAIFVSFNFATEGSLQRVVSLASERGMAVFAREPFIKGRLFRFAAEAGFEDRSRVAVASLRWVLSHQEVSVAVIGVDTAEQLRGNLRAIEDPMLNDEDRKILDAMRATSSYRDYVSGTG
jgi:aryl-alcohol dehydrogenase-like predicted oxidoreductase